MQTRIQNAKVLYIHLQDDHQKIICT